MNQVFYFILLDFTPHSGDLSVVCPKTHLYVYLHALPPIAAILCHGRMSEPPILRYYWRCQIFGRCFNITPHLTCLSVTFIVKSPENRSQGLDIPPTSQCSSFMVQVKAPQAFLCKIQGLLTEEQGKAGVGVGEGGCGTKAAQQK